MIQQIARMDEIDVEILELLFHSRNGGVLPKGISAHLQDSSSSHNVERRQVSRRILRMNKRLETEIGERLVEKRVGTGL